MGKLERLAVALGQRLEPHGGLGLVADPGHRDEQGRGGIEQPSHGGTGGGVEAPLPGRSQQSELLAVALGDRPLEAALPAQGSGQAPGLPDGRFPAGQGKGRERRMVLPVAGAAEQGLAAPQGAVRA